MITTTITTVTIHAAATYPSMDIGIDWIRNIHVNQNGWNDVGYHWFIQRDGTLEQGRPEHVMGAHTKGYNRGNIGVCMAGGLKEGTREPEDNFTEAQWESLNGLMDTLFSKYGQIRIMGHNGFPGHESRGCPCFDWRAYRESYALRREEPKGWYEHTVKVPRE